MRTRRSRLLVLAALLLPAAGLGTELLPHAHPAFEDDRVGHDMSRAIGPEPCRAGSHWDAAEPLHHPACAACAWIARPCVRPLVPAPIARPEAAGDAPRVSPVWRHIERAYVPSRGRAPPPTPSLPA